MCLRKKVRRRKREVVRPLILLLNVDVFYTKTGVARN